MKRTLAVPTLAFIAAMSCNAIAQDVILPLKEEVQTDEGKICIYGTDTQNEKVIMQGTDSCPPTKTAKQQK
ncbi:hypothetical protein [Klebsiella oxytoca]|uniref:hypothetical protein n=1 Tax=Klebsiella oxytoca TaxID=571 RepID=UPI00157A8CC4|nr:hypothetical protein [Klebsiella oxytoca]